MKNKKPAVWALAIILLLVLSEATARWILHRVYARDFDSSLIVTNKYFDSDGLKPNATGRVWGKNFSTDRYGGRSTGIQTQSTKKKFLFIGDSVTEGVGVDDESTFSSLAARQLTEYELVNLSLIGYSTKDYINVIAYQLQNDTSVELINLFYCLNDVYAGTPNAGLPQMASSTLWSQCSKVLQEKISLYHLLKLWYFRNADNYYRYDAAFYETGNAYFQKAMHQLRVCDSLCKASNVFFNVMLLPYRSQLRPGYDTTLAPQQLVAAYCKQYGISYNDASDFFRNEKNPECLFLFADEIHFSKKGHQKMASFLLE